MLSVTGHARLQASLRIAQLAKQASVDASANRSLPMFTTEPADAVPNSDRSKVALTRNFIGKSPCLSKQQRLFFTDINDLADTTFRCWVGCRSPPDAASDHPRIRMTDPAIPVEHDGAPHSRNQVPRKPCGHLSREPRCSKYRE